MEENKSAAKKHGAYASISEEAVFFKPTYGKKKTKNSHLLYYKNNLM